MDLKILWTDIVHLKNMEEGVTAMMISQVSSIVWGDPGKVHIISIKWPDPRQHTQDAQNVSCCASSITSGIVCMHLALEEGVCGEGAGWIVVEVPKELLLQSRESSSRLKQVAWRG